MHLKVDNLSKEFSGNTILHNLSFEARAGFILGILGPKNAGKTTLLRMLMDIVRPTSGLILYDDRPVNAKIRNAIGYLPQERGLYIEYTVNQVLVHFARLKRFSRKKAQVEAVRLMDRFNIIEQMDTPVLHLSEEVRQKVQLMAAIIHNPDLLILDEPFNKMDPGNQALIRKLVLHLKEEGKTIILATDEMNEAEVVCDEILMLNEGRVVIQDTLGNIRDKFREHMIYLETADDLQALQDIFGVKKITQNHEGVRLYVDGKHSPQKVLDSVIRAVDVKKLEIHRPNLQDIYADITAPKSRKGKA